MSEILNTGFIWLHSLATTLFVGYFLVLSLIVIPPLAEAENGKALSSISRTSRRWMYISLLTFIGSGVYLMFVDPSYLGIGDFGNGWGLAMLAKHALVIGMLAAGLWFNAFQRVGPRMVTSHEPAQAIERFRQYASAMSWMGAGVLLLTALAQIN